MSSYPIIFARIIAIADTFDAVTSYRHYRNAKSPEEARQIIIDQSGQQFDPELVEIFLKVYPAMEDYYKLQL